MHQPLIKTSSPYIILVFLNFVVAHTQNVCIMPPDTPFAKVICTIPQICNRKETILNASAGITFFSLSKVTQCRSRFRICKSDDLRSSHIISIGVLSVFSQLLLELEAGVLHKRMVFVPKRRSGKVSRKIDRLACRQRIYRSCCTTLTCQARNE